MSWAIQERGEHERRLSRGGRVLSCAELLDGWRSDAALRSWFLGWLRGAPFEAVYLEVAPMTSATQDEPFTWVLLDAPDLAGLRPAPEAFREHFDAAAGADVVTFANLGRDAVLVAPTPRAPAAVYPHLATFVRRAPVAQQHALLQAVANAAAARLSTRPLWLSTAGLGVAWLHVRLDDRPKYYHHGPFMGHP